MSKALLEEQLAYLSKYKTITSVLAIADTIKDGHNAKSVSAISIDDGYADFFHYAYPVIRKFNLPATFYVTSGFVNGDIWMWYDQVDYLHQKNLDNFVPSSNELLVTYGLKTINSYGELVSQLKSIANSDKLNFIEELSSSLKTPIPEQAPVEYQACNWDQVRELHKNGITIGAHSHTHPILSQCSPNVQNDEIQQSKSILENQLQTEIVDFCYPNGMTCDYTDETIKAVKENGFSYAVAAFTDGITHPDPYQIRRHGGVSSIDEFKNHSSGIEVLSRRARKMKA